MRRSERKLQRKARRVICGLSTWFKIYLTVKLIFVEVAARSLEPSKYQTTLQVPLARVLTVASWNIPPLLSRGTTEATVQTAGVVEAARIGLPILSSPEFAPLVKSKDDAK
jgi:hypothetical protein